MFVIFVCNSVFKNILFLIISLEQLYFFNKNNYYFIFLNQHRSKSQALSSAERDQIFGGADLFLSIALNYQLALM